MMKLKCSNNSCFQEIFIDREKFAALALNQLRIQNNIKEAEAAQLNVNELVSY